MRPIGGYFSLELSKGSEYHPDAIKLNAGRYALEYILKTRKYRKVFLPYFICESVLQPFSRLNVAYEFYHINEQLEPAEIIRPNDNEAMLYVNYFGIKNRFAKSLCHTYNSIILDNTQAFYFKIGDLDGDDTIRYDSFYSCRKFFGVPDGAYLYSNYHLDVELPMDESYKRMTFLTKRIDRSPSEGYADFQYNDKLLSEVGMRRMSRLTERVLQGIDYDAKASRRIKNFNILDNVLRFNNRFNWDFDNETVPLVYPLFVEHGAELRQKLIDNQVFCARYWPNVLEWCRPSDWEYRLAENLVCLPIDQRYGDDEMNYIIQLVCAFL